MNRDDAISKVTQELSRKLSDDGKIIEAGWAIFRSMFLPVNVSDAQANDMQVAFFAGAQHLWGSVFSALEEGIEPTEADERRMDKINNELTNFAKRLKASMDTK